MKHLRLALAFALCLFCVSTLLADETSLPAATSLAQLAAQIFVAEVEPPLADSLAELGLGWNAKSHCTGGACAVWICTCQEDCAPCGIQKVTCATGICICNPPC